MVRIGDIVGHVDPIVSPLCDISHLMLVRVIYQYLSSRIAGVLANSMSHSLSHLYYLEGAPCHSMHN